MCLELMGEELPDKRPGHLGHVSSENLDKMETGANSPRDKMQTVSSVCIFVPFFFFYLYFQCYNPECNSLFRLEATV